MKKAIHFGAGNIGRGFIGPVLQDNNYEVIFVDVDERLIDKLNASKEYKVFKPVSYTHLTLPTKCWV